MKLTAIMVDIDGTLAHMRDRSPYEWHRVGEDKVDPVISHILDCYEGMNKIILLSGRDSVCRPETEDWLKDNAIPYDLLVMRKENDNRKDSIIKWELFQEHIEPNYNVLFVLDDRNQVVKMWREKGLKCLQVADGDF